MPRKPKKELSQEEKKNLMKQRIEELEAQKSELELECRSLTSESAQIMKSQVPTIYEIIEEEIMEIKSDIVAGDEEKALLEQELKKL